MPPAPFCVKTLKTLYNFYRFCYNFFMKIADDWVDYKIIATSDGMKLENWNGVTLLRPDPQVIWKGDDLFSRKGIHAVYKRSDKGGGGWDIRGKFPAEWEISYRDLKFKIKPMGFKHTGLFPEQAVNWDFCAEKIRQAGRLRPAGMDMNSPPPALS